LGRAHEVCKGREDRLTKEDMGGAGVGEDGGRGDRAQQIGECDDSRRRRNRQIPTRRRSWGERNERLVMKRL
jgi:hypothetical protein